MSKRIADEAKLELFISAMERCCEPELDVPVELVVSTDEAGWKHWRPKRVQTDRSALHFLYADLGLPGRGNLRFPTFYEKMIMSYRWAEVELGDYRLLPNPPGPDLIGLAKEIRRDQGLWEVLYPNGYIPFGKGPGADYDPICFDLRHRKKDGDCRVVKLDHEEILCNSRIKEVSEPAPSFNVLVLMTIGTFNPPLSLPR